MARSRNFNSDIKRCPCCGDTKARSEFYRTSDKGSTGGFRTAALCKLCSRQYTASQNYGITRDEYLELISKTECSLCGRSIAYANRTLHIDHDHLTNKVRGVLCPGCNTGLGKFNDDVELLAKAIEYINRRG